MLPDWSRCINFLAVAIGGWLAIADRHEVLTSNSKKKVSSKQAHLWQSVGNATAVSPVERKPRISPVGTGRPGPQDISKKKLVAKPKHATAASIATEQKLGDIVDAKPLDIQDWPALGAPQASPKASRQTKLTAKPAGKAALMKAPGDAAPSWLVPMPAAPPAAAYDGMKAAQPPPTLPLVQTPKLGL